MPPQAHQLITSYRRYINDTAVSSWEVGFFKGPAKVVSARDEGVPLEPPQQVCH